MMSFLNRKVCSPYQKNELPYISSDEQLIYKGKLKCHCKHTNGKEENNGIMCGIVDGKTNSVLGIYQKVSECDVNDWCTGPSDNTKSIPGLNFGKSQLCSIGNKPEFEKIQNRHIRV